MTEREPFRLALLFKPSYLLPRLRSLRSARDAAGRAAGVLRYIYFGAVNAGYAARGGLIKSVQFAGRAGGAAFGEAAGACRRAASAALAPARLAAGLRRELRLYRAAAGYRASRPAAPVPNPPHPSSALPPPDVRLSWNIHLACNYRCPYCWSVNGGAEHAGGGVQLTPDGWAAHWDRFNDRYGRAEIYIGGGEPFLYPGFAEIAARLSERNVVGVITNLHWDPALAARRLDPARVAFSASYHAAAAGPAEAFAEKICRLRRAGFNTTASIVAYPPDLPELPGRVDAFMARGIFPVVQPFRGAWRGGQYPGAYTRAERRLTDWLAGGGFLKHYPGLARPAGGPPGGPGDDFARGYMLAPRRTRGLPCEAGRLYGRLQANGDMLRCSQGGFVSNFFDKDFSMAGSAEPCPFRTCECPNEVVYVEGGPCGPAVRKAS